MDSTIAPSILTTVCQINRAGIPALVLTVFFSCVTNSYAAYDTDSDGMPDTWEQNWNLNPNDPADATQDPDGDGDNNLLEFQNGTAPQVAGVTPVFSVVEAYTFNAPVPGNNFGASISDAGDVNNDGYGDIIIGSPGNDRAYIYSGLDGTELYSLNAGPSGANFGVVVSGVGDINSDNYDDVIIANNEAFWVYSGFDGSIFNTTAGGVPASVSGAGDFNNDGTLDVMVGDIAAEQVKVYSGADYSVLATLSGVVGDDFGRSISGLGDINSDNYDDVIVGSNTYFKVYSGFDNSELYASTAGATVEVGPAVTGTGDMTADNVPDWAVIATGTSDFWRSFDSITFTIIQNKLLNGIEDIGNAGDVDGDGFMDFVAGSSSIGVMRVISGNTQSQLMARTDLTAGFGFQVDGAGDTNGDGFADVMTTAVNDEVVKVFTRLRDADVDGVNDVNDLYPFDPTETADTDGDGVPDNQDGCPLDPAGTIDTDDDGVCNYIDTDDDNDTIPDFLDLPPGRDPLVVDWVVSAGVTHSCVLDDTGVECWGTPVPSSFLGPVITVATGTLSCVLYEDPFVPINGVQCFSVNLPPIGEFQDPVTLTVGNNHVCALESFGAVSCWSWDAIGQYDYAQSIVPVLANPVQVSAGGNLNYPSGHTCAIDDTGVVCWGAGTTNNPTVAEPQEYGQSLVPLLSNPKMVSAGLLHTCAIDDTGVVCWGAGTTTTQIIGFNPTDEHRPFEYGQSIVPPLINPSAVSAGGSHTCAIDETGVVCWGDSGEGKTTVPAIVNPVQLSAGDRHTCVLDDTGVVCWGGSNGAIVPPLPFDKDLDGLIDDIEDTNSNAIVDVGETDPLDADSDNDGALDGEEDANSNGIVDAGETDPLNPDTDSDGLLDGIEDGNGNGIVDAGETDPLNNDSDGDGALDGQEDTNGNGIVDAGEANPLNFDSDGDGLTDGYEINTEGSDPTSANTVYTEQSLPNPGDMNSDGNINAGDIILLQREVLGN